MKKLIGFVVFFLSLSNLSAQNLQDTVGLRGFMDGVILTHLRDKHIAGATVAVTYKGKTILAKGYGFSNEQKQTPVSADSTLFRIGSISKMFTWMSVMQLVSQGKLKLDEDINHYLKDFKIPDTWPQPITLKNLMTHTPGFEDLVIGLFGKDSTTIKPLGEILSKEIPVRVRPAGTFASYSNHGTGMAAYIVEQVSGMSFNDYVETNILKPLGMNFTTFRQPLPGDLKPYMSTGYAYENGEFVKKPFEYVPLYPAGAAAASATDMTKFMEAILHQGAWSGAKILDSATLKLMESPAHQHHNSVNPMRYGFMDMSQNGELIIGHGGDTFYFHSLMALLPAHDVGLFVSFNTDKGGGAYLQVLDEFMDRYFPEKPFRPSIKLGKGTLEEFAGKYRANRYAYHDITTISSLFGDIEVSVDDSTGLKVVSGETVQHIIPIDSTTFRELHGSKVIAFSKNEKGQIAHMFIGQLPIFALDKVTGVKGMGFQSTVFMFTIITMIITLLFWPLTYWVRRDYYPKGTIHSLPASAKWLAWLNFLLLIIFYVGVASSVSDPTDIVFGIGKSLKTLLFLPLISIVFTLGVWYWVVQIWRGSGYRFLSRVYYLIVALAATIALWQLYYWNFIGFNY